MTKRSTGEYIAAGERLRTAWAPAVEVPSPGRDENGYRRHTPWRAYVCPECRALVEERHLVLHYDVHERLRAWPAE